MKLYSENDNYKLYSGSMLDMLEVIEPETIDSIVTDPPYELNFMGKGWDNAGVSFQPDTWKKCYEVLKPGGYLLAFGGSRTFHRIACAIEDTGFEIRDTIMWLYGSGFPKSMNIGLAIDKKNGVDNRTGNIKTDGIATNSGSGCYNCNNGKDNSMKQEYEERKATNEWAGWGTALKPSFEPIIVARKPFKGSLVDNVIEYGVGGINIDECRVGETGGVKKINIEPNSGSKNSGFGCNGELEELNNGRFPANTILTYDETDFDEVCGGFPNTKTGTVKVGNTNSNGLFGSGKTFIPNQVNGGDSGSASRYFMNCKYTGKDEEFRRYIYTPKASKKDRDEGLDEFEEKQKYYCDGRGNSLEIFGSTDGGRKPLKNIHPTVKPTELMQYLVRLVSPDGGVILDPFNGSGSTGKAVMYENYERNKDYKYIGIELTEEYLPISKARIEYVCNLKPEINPQMSIFDFKGSEQE